MIFSKSDKPRPHSCATAERFPIGALVMLQSGGPTMTVTYASPSEVSVAWFNGRKLCCEEFDPACLDTDTEGVPF